MPMPSLSPSPIDGADRESVDQLMDQLHQAKLFKGETTMEDHSGKSTDPMRVLAWTDIPVDVVALEALMPYWLIIKDNGRCIDMRDIPPQYLFGCNHDHLAKLAFDHVNNTQLVKLCVSNISDEFITHILGRTPNLECLCISKIVSHDLSPDLLNDFLSRCPKLWDLRLHDTFLDPETIGAIGCTCTDLTHFSLDGYCESDPDLGDEEAIGYMDCFVGDVGYCDTDSDLGDEDCFIVPYADSAAQQIATNMPKLQVLKFIAAGSLTIKGLTHIVNNCLHLNTLDLRCCINLHVDAHLQDKLNAIEDVRLSPRASSSA